MFHGLELTRYDVAFENVAVLVSWNFVFLANSIIGVLGSTTVCC